MYLILYVQQGGNFITNETNLRIAQAGEAPLHVAAQNNSLDVAEILIRSGTDLNAKDKVYSALIHPLLVTLCLKF